MVRQKKFEPIGEYLSADIAFVQAAHALDIAAMLAQKQDDVEGLTNVAALYIELGARMVDEPEEEVDEEALAKKQPLGYAPCPPAVVPVEEGVELEDE